MYERMNKRINLGAAAIVALTSSIAVGAAEVPLGSAFTYQGRLTQNGNSVHGDVDFEFSLWTEEEDGTRVAGPVGATLTVTQGLFTHDNLDFGFDVFDGQERWLEIAVEDETLTPRQRVAPTPYALFSTRPWQTTGNDIFFDGSRVGMGTDSPAFRLDVRSPAPRAIFGWVTNTTGTNYGVYGQTASSEGGAGVLGTASADTGPTTGVYGLAQSDTGKGVFGLAQNNQGENYGVYGQTNSRSGGRGVYGEATANSGTAYGVYGRTNSPSGFAGYFTGGRSYFGGDVGIGNAAPDARLHVRRALGAQSPTMIVETLADPPFAFPTTIEFEGNAIDSYFRGGTSALRLNPNSAGNVLLGLGGGNVGIGTPTPLRRLHVVDEDVNLKDEHLASDEVAMIEHDNAFLGIYSNGGGDWGSGIVLGQINEREGTLTDKWAIVRRSTGSGGGLQFRYGTERNPRHADNPSMMTIRTNGTVSVRVLEIRGADLAERFLSSGDAEPGTVMEIDPERVGHVRVARGAYNRRVAGVVSGANNLPAGAILGNLPGHEEATPIALSGRVWVRCDATAGGIEPGDLLTTADREGHAMKVEDHARATGAIIGKAMSVLSKGDTGTVLVLVNLQ